MATKTNRKPQFQIRKHVIKSITANMTDQAYRSKTNSSKAKMISEHLRKIPSVNNKNQEYSK